MKRVFKYLGRIILAIFLLLFLVIFLLYLPPVQRYVKNKAVAYVSNNYGLALKVGYFRLGFPLELTFEEVYAGFSETDTLAVVDALHLKVGLAQIFRQQLSVNNFVVQGVKFRISNDTSGMKFRLDLNRLDLTARRVDLKTKRVEVEQINLVQGGVFLMSGESSVSDTTASAPLDWVFQVDGIKLQQVDYRMTTSTLPFLGAGVNMGELVRGEVDLGKQIVRVDSLGISGGWCRMQTSETTSVGQAATEVPDSLESLPWTVRAGTLALDNSTFSMITGRDTIGEFVLSGIGIQVDSVFNQGTIVRAQLKELKAVQKEGITLTDMQADVDLDSTSTSLQGGYIRTPYSWIRLDVQTETDIQHLLKREPLSVVLSGRVGLQDVIPFYGDLPMTIRNKSVNVNTVLSVTDKRLQVGQLILDMPGHFKITGSGSLSSYLDVKKMRGSFILRGELPDITFARDFFQDAGVQIPLHMDMLARLKAESGNLGTLLRLCCEQGCMTLDGSYALAAEQYDGELTLNRFPLGQFFPADSLGDLSATVRLSGKNFTWEKAKAEINAEIQQFHFYSHDYQDVRLTASLDKTIFHGVLTSTDESAPFDLVFRGDSVGQDYAVSLGGRLGPVDVEALHFVREPFTLATDIDLRATMGADESYTLYLRMDSVKMTDAYRKYMLGSLVVDMDSDREKTTLGMNSGDLKLQFQTDTSLTGFVTNMGKVAEGVGRQIQERNVNMELVREDLPPFSLQITGGQRNAISRFLNSREVGFKDLMVDIVSRRRNGIRVGMVAKAPYFGTVRLDSVQLGAWQTGKSLMYSFSAGSSSEAWKGLFNINLTGRMQGDRFRVELKQKDAAGRIGFDLGVNTIIGDSTFTVSFFPMNPILGYSRWMVNAENRIIIGEHGKINANLRMAYLNKLVNIQSLEDKGDMHDRLQIEIAGVELASLSQMVPFMPELSGKLNTDLMLYSRNKEVGADGNVQVVELEYEKQRIGTVDLGLQYVGGDNFTNHAVNFELKIDSIRRAIVEGSFFTSEENRRLAVDMDIPSMPLYIVNAFIPSDLMKLTGDLVGHVRFRGTVDEPALNGSLAFQDGRADVVMLGTTFRLDTTSIPIEDGRILFQKYRLIAPNNSNMIVNGRIALTPFDRMNMDLAINANNFEVINVKKNETSLLYGKAYVDIYARIAGAFSNLSVTGNINLLNRTGITYTLRSSDPDLVDKSVDLVRFVSFRDSTLNEKDDLTNRVNASSFALRMLIEIGDQVKVGVDLSEDGSNHVSIQGGGNLVLAMNPESGMSLSGKYILSGGTVEYNVPIVGKKEFNIRSGSFVEWTGNVMNPLLNISASEQVKANVEDGDQTRQVVFEAIIRIQNTLTRPDITFDLSAPNDMVIQNQLATFSAEERTRQALNLLIYNTYTAPGAAKTSSGGNMANNAIYSFVENEMNKYTRKAGLTVGFDSHNTDENTTRTDVTYQFSRQLFNDRVRVKIGGRISTDGNEGQGNTLQDNLVDDISIEYVLTKKRNLYVKVFRHSNYESVLDGEVTQTGVGIVWRKNFRKFKDLFKNNRRLVREKQERNERN